MQKAAETTTSQSLPGATLSDFPATAQYVPLSQFKLIRRNGAVAGFDPTEISVVESKSFLSVYGGLGAASVRIREFVEGPTAGAVIGLGRRPDPDACPAG